jgi:hypothetical protein
MPKLLLVFGQTNRFPQLVTVAVFTIVIVIRGRGAQVEWVSVMVLRVYEHSGHDVVSVRVRVIMHVVAPHKVVIVASEIC